jgi:hypothetical protein
MTMLLPPNIQGGSIFNVVNLYREEVRNDPNGSTKFSNVTRGWYLMGDPVTIWVITLAFSNPTQTG